MAIAKTLLTKYKVDSAGAEKGLSSIVGVATKAAAALAGIGTRVLAIEKPQTCLLYTSPSPRDRQKSRMPSSA